MATNRKTITLTEQQNQWVKAQIASGDFTNDSEYIRDLIRRDQARKKQIDALRAELLLGEESGEPQRFDIDEFRTRMALKYARDET
ncbi:MAG: addiction module antitoxin [Lysobacteraceae bacterium]|nr:MAG: addiction module antitoxin [Xanthomonadaceae bacterium]